MNARTFLLLLLLACLTIAGSCGAEVHAEWTVTFDDAADASQSTAIAVWIIDGGCSGTEVIHDAYVEADAGPTPQALRPGRYGFAAEARDASCAPLAYGCVERVMPREGDVPVAVTLFGVADAARCDAASCMNGRCPANTPIVSGDCPEGIRRPGGSCYRYYDLNLTFDDGQALCELWEGDLVVPGDVVEGSWLIATFGAANDFWIGLTDRETEDVWLDPDGNEGTYFDWYTDEPNEGTDANCVRYTVEVDAWRDRSCASEFRVICERP